MSTLPYYTGFLLVGCPVHLRGDDEPRRLLHMFTPYEPAFTARATVAYGAFGRNVDDEVRTFFQVDGLAGVYHRGHLHLDDTRAAVAEYCRRKRFGL